MSYRIEVIAMLTDRIAKVNEDTRPNSVDALLALSTAALAMETLCQAEAADKKARVDRDLDVAKKGLPYGRHTIGGKK